MKLKWRVKLVKAQRRRTSAGLACYSTRYSVIIKLISVSKHIHDESGRGRRIPLVLLLQFSQKHPGLKLMIDEWSNDINATFKSPFLWHLPFFPYLSSPVHSFQVWKMEAWIWVTSTMSWPLSSVTVITKPCISEMVTLPEGVNCHDLSYINV